VVNLTVAGVPVAQTAVQFAYLPRGQHPVDSDFTSPYLQPGGTAFGVWAAAVATPGSWGIWARVQSSPEIPVLDPYSVGWVIRT
jgi:hypothetical protein